MTSPEDEGYVAGQTAVGLGANPYTLTQGSPTRVAAIAWKKGYLRGQREKEIEDQEMSEDIFFR